MAKPRKEKKRGIARPDSWEQKNTRGKRVMGQKRDAEKGKIRGLGGGTVDMGGAGTVTRKMMGVKGGIVILGKKWSAGGMSFSDDIVQSKERKTVPTGGRIIHEDTLQLTPSKKRKNLFGHRFHKRCRGGKKLLQIFVNSVNHFALK